MLFATVEKTEEEEDPLEWIMEEAEDDYVKTR